MTLPAVVVDSADVSKEVEKLAQLISAHVHHVDQQLAGDLAAVPGSPAFLEQDRHEEGPGGPWGSVPAHTVMTLASFKLTVARDHIVSLHKLLQPPHSLYGLTVMTRMVVEAAGKAFWLLDPELSVRDRVARELGDRLVSAEEEREALKLLVDGWTDSKEVEAIRAEALELGVTARRPPHYDTLAGEVLVQSTGSRRQGVGWYRFWSAVAHGTSYAALQHFETVGPSEDERSYIIQGRLPFGAIYNSVGASLSAHMSAVERMLLYLGKDTWGWDRWKSKIAQDMTAASTYVRPRVPPTDGS